MKTFFTWLIFLACAQCPAQTDLRIIQTAARPRLYDFTKAGPAFHLDGTHLHFVRAFTNSVIFKGTLLFQVFAPEIPPETGDVAQDSSRLIALTRPDVWEDLGGAGNNEEHATHVQICILHPPNNLSPNYFALPRFGGTWDYGVPFNGDTLNFPGIYKIIGNKIVYDPIPNSYFAITNDFQHASNSIPYYQFKVSQRYLNGQGVETNRDLAIYWASLAASNSYPDAIKFLSQPTPHTP